MTGPYGEAGPARTIEAIDQIEMALLGGGGHVLATIWATVDLERALGERTALAPEGIGPALAEPHLGARVVVAEAPAPDGVPLAVAEPTTEGRLAATLARHGEGEVGRYVAVPSPLDEIARAAAAIGIAVSRPADGPFGRSILVLHGPVTGPHLIIVEAPAVPSRR